MAYSHRLLLWLCLLSLGCSKPSTPAPAHPTATVTKALHLVTSQWPPFAGTGDEPKIALDLVSGALARAGYQTQFDFVPEGTVTSAAQEGRFDGAPAMWRSPEREARFLYSNPYLENRLMLVGAKGSNVNAASFADLKGKKIGIVRGYAYGPTLESATAPVFVAGGSSEENLRALLRGELDYVLEDALVLHHLSQLYPAEVQARLAVGERALVTRTLHLALRRDIPDAALVIDRFNQQLDRMLTDGSYHRALEVDWINADVDHDGQSELVAASEKLGTAPPSASYQLMTIGSPLGQSGPRDHEPAPARFVVRGVPYDSWSAVPDDFKAPSDSLGAKPRTLRASVFEF